MTAKPRKPLLVNLAMSRWKVSLAVLGGIVGTAECAYGVLFRLHGDDAAQIATIVLVSMMGDVYPVAVLLVMVWFTRDRASPTLRYPCAVAIALGATLSAIGSIAGALNGITISPGNFESAIVIAMVGANYGLWAGLFSGAIAGGCATLAKICRTPAVGSILGVIAGAVVPPVLVHVCLGGGEVWFAIVVPSALGALSVLSCLRLASGARSGAHESAYLP